MHDRDRLSSPRSLNKQQNIACQQQAIGGVEVAQSGVWFFIKRPNVRKFHTPDTRPTRSIEATYTHAQGDTTTAKRAVARGATQQVSLGDCERGMVA